MTQTEFTAAVLAPFVILPVVTIIIIGITIAAVHIKERIQRKRRKSKR